MKKYFLFFAVGLLACAGPRIDREFGGYNPDGEMSVLSSTQALKSSNSDSGFLCLGCTNLGLSHERTIPDSFKNESDGIVWESDTDDSPELSILEDKVAQQFDVRVTITFPRMTLQQAAELEARVRKIFPEAQEIDFGLEKKVEVPAESFYYDMPDGVEFRILPGLTFPLQDLKNGNILKADSTGTPAWKVF